jgi:arginase
MRFVVVPQWQGSPSSRAMRLSEGAYAVLGDLPAKSTTLVEVPVGAGDSLGTRVHRFSSVVGIARSLRRELETDPAPALVVGGDCGVEYAAVGHALGPDTAVVWFDAHPDLHSPRTSESGAFSGMVLRALTGDGTDELGALDDGTTPVRLTPDRIVLAGTRSYDDAEDTWVESRRVRSVSSLDLSPEEVVEAVAATGATEVYVHVDLDVLDPVSVDGLLEPQPFGLEPAVLVATIAALKERFTLVGAGLCSFAPVDADAAADDMGTILRVVGALAR